MNNVTMNKARVIAREWLWRNKAMIGVAFLWWCALVYVAIIWHREYDSPIDWLGIAGELRQHTAAILGALLLLTIWLAGNMRWSTRAGCSLLAVLFVLPMILCAGWSPRFLQISTHEYVGSVYFDKHIYHIVSVELSGQYYSIYQCNELGIDCYEVDYFAGFRTGERVTLFVNPDGKSLTVLSVGINGYEVLHEYRPRPDSPP